MYAVHGYVPFRICVRKHIISRLHTSLPCDAAYLFLNQMNAKHLTKKKSSKRKIYPKNSSVSLNAHFLINWNRDDVSDSMFATTDSLATPPAPPSNKPKLRIANSICHWLFPGPKFIIFICTGRWTWFGKWYTYMQCHRTHSLVCIITDIICQINTTDLNNYE